MPERYQGAILSVHDRGEVDAVSRGIRALAVFAGLATVPAWYAAVTLLFPGTLFDVPWRVNPEGHAGLLRLGIWAVLLMTLVGLACLVTARGLWLGRPWARRLAIVILAG